MKKYKKVYVEITNICNLKCDFCPDTNRELKYLNTGEFLHIISEIRPFTDYVYFHLMGEPLLNPDIEGFFSICSQFGLKVNITTNGTLLEKHRQLLVQAPALRKVSISLHSYEANLTKISLEHYLNETFDFVREAGQKGIICELRLWNAESEGIKASNSLNVNIIKKLEEEFELDIDLQKELLLRQNIKLADKVFLHLAQKFEWPDIERADIDDGVFCYGLRDQFGVLVDGTVVPCCLDSNGNIPLGNLFEQPLEDILTSSRAVSIYEGFTARTAVEDLCKKCGYAVRHKRT